MFVEKACGFRWCALLPLVATGSLGAAWGAPQEIIIQEPARPENVIKSVSGKCGKNRFEVAIEPGPNINTEAIAINVNGRALSPTAVSAVIEKLSPNSQLMDAYLNECSRQADNIRVRLVLVENPGVSSEIYFVFFWLNDKGQISNIHRD